MTDAPPAPAAPTAARRRVGMVSLGCPKALVDSERILTRLKGEGYDTSPDYAGADAVVVNTCAFLDSARAESLEAIAEAQASGKPVIVTGCLGAEEALIRDHTPGVAAVTGAHAYEAVAEAVRRHAPQPFAELAPVPAEGLRLTPRHYAYLKISEGCDHRCAFCIIPQLRGDLASRPAAEVLAEARALLDAGVKELLVVSQDTSAYGLDLRYAESDFEGRRVRAHMTDLARELGALAQPYGAWVRLHYVYPYPHVDQVIPLMGDGADGGLAPYLDIPFQHAAPSVLKAMKRPANGGRVLERIAAWRAVRPELAIRSTFVVGFPGETEADFQHLLDWLAEAKLDRVGAFAYENVAGAPARDLPGHVPEEVKQDRRERLLAHAGRLSRERLRRHLGRELRVLVDGVGRDGVATARTAWDAPEVDGVVRVRNGGHLAPGAFARVRVERTDAFDLHAVSLDTPPRLAATPRRLHRLVSRR
ncbi:MAG: 30S ribosomal protein S12 methylthiotransferase RimO [Caulobacteraceae bacterium]|nr:30S ribosomal protein S12 methylthiotransferase RimO [Caulobacter sp.]